MNHYDYHRPSTLDEAFRLLAESAGARLIAGGTDLLVQMKKRRDPGPPALISLRGIEELRRIDADKSIRIGSCAPLDEVARHPKVKEWFTALAHSIDVLGSRQIRNVATLGGNLCNASPGADTAPPLLVYGAHIEVRAVGGTRSIPVDEFFVGPGQTSLGPGEIVSAVVIDRPSTYTRSVFVRKGRVMMDLAIASLAVLFEMDGGICRGARVAAGAVAPVPLRLKRVEALMEGSSLDDATLSRAQALAGVEISPITDLRSTEEYRRDLIGVFLGRAVRQLLAPGHAQAGGVA
jgi:carbon-monoxide dehydrogenase medium subunit